LFPSELAFFIYLLSSLRFLGSFALFCYNSSKYWKWVMSLLVLEFYFGALAAMFHDALMWLLFFALFYVYNKKPSILIRLVGLSFCVIFILFIQGIKGAYRSKIRETGSSSLVMFTETSAEVSDDLTSEENLLGSLSRGNQAWIFASTVQRMDKVGDFQGINILGIYIEAALLPRFLAPNKLKSGDKDIFNEFSGHRINDTTSMGLGVFADGYIANGLWGVLFFTFGLGFIFNITFRIIESWAKISEFYVFMSLPLLNYAVRPDCELQTIINHLFKGLIVFGIIVALTKFRFSFNSGNSNQKTNKVLPTILG
jgi:hypothetical protein